MKYLFLVGCPRSGTTWMSWLLAQHPATVVAFHTGFFLVLRRSLDWMERPAGFGNRVVGAGGAGADRERQVGLSEFVTREELHAACRPLAQCLLDGVARANAEADWVVDKTPENLLEADLIREILPEARFLHVIRDPRAVFSSMRAAAKQWAFPGDLPTNPIAFSRGYWNLYVDAHHRLVTEPDHYRAVLYEDMLQDAAGELAGIFEWLDLPADRSLCERAVEASSIDRMRTKLSAPEGFFRVGRADTWRDDLSRYQLKAIEYLSGERMEGLGYHCISPKPRREPMRLKMSDALAATGQRLLRGPLARPMNRLFGRARRSSETIRRMTESS